MSDPTHIDDALERVLDRLRVHVASPERLDAYEASVEKARAEDRRKAAERRQRELVAGGWPLPDETLDAVVHGRLGSTRALARVSAWMQAPWPVLVLLGDPGTGKTTAAAHAAASRSGACVYVREQTLGRWWAGDRYERERRSVLTAPTVVVDELGTAPDRALVDVRLALLELVDARQRGNVRTVLVGNLDEGRWHARYDARMHSRLALVAQRWIVRGRDMRRREEP